jgi:zinc transporter
MPGGDVRRRRAVSGMSVTDDPVAMIAATLNEPGLVWSFRPDEEPARRLQFEVPPGDDGFRWVHLNLADQRSLRWLENHSGLSPALLTPMLASDGHARVVVEHGAVGLVLHDFERGLAETGSGQIDTLRIAATDRLLITARAHPLQCADLVRERLSNGTVAPETGAAALSFLIGTMVDSLAALVLDLTQQLLDTETELMTNDEAPDTRELIAARRRSAQIHRLVGGMRASLRRMDGEPGLTFEYALIPREQEPRLAALDADIVGIQQQLRLLRDEIDLQTAQRTNRNVYLLSILTALLMPATLVTGFFGMNTDGMPFTHGAYGTLVAGLIAFGSAGMSYWLLGRMGLIGRGS